MAKSYTKTISISATGTYFLDGDIPMIEIDEIGELPLKEVLSLVENQDISLTVKVKDEIVE